MRLIDLTRVVALFSFTGALLESQRLNTADLLQQAEQQIKAEQLASAEALLQQVLRQAPADTEALYRLGYVRFRKRELMSARASFASVVKLAPPAFNSCYFLGRISLLENKPKEAIQWLEPVVAANQTNFDAASQLAKAYASVGELRKAVPALKTAILQAPWDGSLHYRLGQLYRRTGENELASDAFATSTRLKSATREDVETLMGISQLLQEGKSAGAVELSARILKRTTVEPDALVALGVILANAKLSAEALQAFERATALDNNLFQAQFNYGLALLKMDRARDALAPLSRAFELLPQSQEAVMTLGLAAVMNQQYGAAKAPLELAYKRDPKNIRLAALLATAYLRSGDAAKAVGILQAISIRAADDPAPQLLLVEALDTSGDTSAALAVALQLQKRFPQFAQGHMVTAQQLVKAGKYEQAGEAFAEVLKLRPGQPEAELGLADSMQKTGRHEAALNHYLAAGISLQSQLGRARSLVALKQLEEARKVLEQAIPEYPSDVTLRFELSRVYARLGEPGLAAEQAKIIEQLRAP